MSQKVTFPQCNNYAINYYWCCISFDLIGKRRQKVYNIYQSNSRSIKNTTECHNFQLTIADWGSSTPRPTGAGVISPTSPGRVSSSEPKPRVTGVGCHTIVVVKRGGARSEKYSSILRDRETGACQCCTNVQSLLNTNTS